MKRTAKPLTQCLLIMTAIAAGCGGSDDETQKKETKESTDNEESESAPLAQDPAKAFQLGIDGYNQKDWKKLWRLFSDKVQWHLERPIHLQRLTGIDARVVGAMQAEQRRLRVV